MSWIIIRNLLKRMFMDLLILSFKILHYQRSKYAWWKNYNINKNKRNSKLILKMLRKTILKLELKKRLIFIKGAHLSLNLDIDREIILSQKISSRKKRRGSSPLQTWWLPKTIGERIKKCLKPRHRLNLNKKWDKNISRWLLLWSLQQVFLWEKTNIPL